MPRIRTIKPEFFGDEKLAPMPVIDRFVFVGLISMADDAGRLVDNVKSIDGFVFPETDDTSRPSLERLAVAGRILRYTSASGQKLIQIIGWAKHQRVDHPNKHVLPAPPNALRSRGEEDAPMDDTAGVAPLSRESRADLAKSSRYDLGPVPVPGTSTGTNDQRPGTGEQESSARAHEALGPTGAPPPLALVEDDEALPDAVTSPGMALVPAPAAAHAVERPRPRDVDAVKLAITREFEQLRDDVARREDARAVLRLKAEMVFAYWATAWSQTRALLDAKREQLILERLDENGGDVSELFYAIDGARGDEFVKRREGALPVLLKDRGAVEEFARKRAAYRRGELHPRAKALDEALHGAPVVAHA
jgi:hypothetical protein